MTAKPKKAGDLLPEHLTQKTHSSKGKKVTEKEAEKILAEAREQSDREFESERLESRQRAVESALGRVIPSRFRQKTFENYQVESDGQKRALNTAKKYAAGFDQVLKNGTSMLFVGDPGTGKTHLACAILNYIIQRKYTGMFISTYRAVMTVFESYGRDRSTNDVLNQFRLPDLLVLDEFGEQSGKQGESRALFEILNSRYEEMKPTILLANEDYRTIEEFLTNKWLSRLEENGGVILRFDWDNYRKKIKFDKA